MVVYTPDQRGSDHARPGERPQEAVASDPAPLLAAAASRSDCPFWW
jgi:hypothetical protein